ncbi:outer membrane lipoprotein carrier protein LolA [Neoroseomonas soli]|uniref:Outer membrane lipoprotein carrier protein LolA n=1 Tax=Neoroseomonas soli TaxID=1081025 RepID=A0A9X9WY68_9PROT|nr:outer membrane lipoprotein carrier protein LolA [Neoroseomonas soli]MBR0672097.1 outer membrane lipoprotein carrier protein LolA [Neoroseomonas soli]
MAALAAVRESRAAFTEERELPELDRPLISRGVLTWRAPDRMEKHTLEPVEERFLADGDTLVLEQPARGIRETMALDAVPEVRPVVEAIRATLAGDLATLREHHEVVFSGTFARWRMVLTPRSLRVRAAVQRVTLEGEGGAILVVETQMRDGRTRMAITPLR